MRNRIHWLPVLSWIALVTMAYLSLVAASSVFAKESCQSENKQSNLSLEKALLPAIEAHRGKVAVAIKHLKSGVSYQYNADAPMPTASLIKFPIMAATYQAIHDGKLSLDTPVELKEDDKVPGSGILTAHFSPGAKISLRDAIHLMIVYSDNTATNLVIDKLGLPTTSEYMESLGYKETTLHAKVYRRDTSIAPERSQKYGLGSTTANEMLRLVEKLHKRELVSKDASEKMLEHMVACDDKQKSPRLLPAGTRVAHKTGSVNASRTDAGIIDSPSGPIAFCILTNENEDQGWSDENEGDMLCAEVARTAYRFFNSKGAKPRAAIARTLRMGDSGDLVEALQRTINARLKPSPGMMVDGDFGPDTESGVKKFQEQEDLKATGVVDSATWRALGPLLMEEEPAPEPAEVNSLAVEKQPADALDGPPYVTAKAWAIVDAETGKLVAGDNEDQRRDPASTTKMMTAFLVTSLAEKDPSILEEVVTFSERANKTSGSTSAIKEGEQIKVGELLYGLLLPSGNDASVALAEHFGRRLAKEHAERNGNADGDTSSNPHDQFVAAMNRKAAEIGMTKTRFKNPHGLTAEGHQTTARDLARLARAALEQPEFAKRVSTPQYGTTVDSVSGYRRNIVWKNTNQLLQRAGYDGVKTGTTSPAGCCLVSRGERDGRRLIVVVLGATSTDSRYADTRNLYRWAWRERLGMNDDNTPSQTASAGAN
jgi:serine-type D-Ala-D-Ala carboxypeptidase (penicillin-binding protein 5/6)